MRVSEPGQCVLALLEVRPLFGLELVRDLAAPGALLTSNGTVYRCCTGCVTLEW